MVHIVNQHIMYILFLAISSLLLIKYTILNKLFTIGIIIRIILYVLQNSNFIANYIKLSLFTKIKSLLVFIPLFFYTFHDMFLNINITEVLSYILALNVAEPGILLGIKSNEILSKITGICLVIVALFTPKLSLENNIIGYDNNHLWGLSKTILLTTVYLFNNYFKEHSWKYAGVYSLIIPLFVSFLANNSRLYLPMRIYSLVLTFIINIKYPEIHSNMSAYLNNRYKLTTDKYDKFKSIFVCIGVIITLCVVFRGTKNTIIDQINNLY